ncbi:MAG TPA: hypothetical protein VN654_22480 [Vicinamibacterales bacterium]|nr:hypothetical protein [Vicinamibacterales bacterium]
MIVRHGMLLVVALTVGASAGWAQAKPDFSGTWRLSGTTPPNYPGSAGWGVPSPTVSIKQSPTEITIQSGQYGATPMSVVYKLDGSDTIWDAPSVTQSGTTATVKWRTKARWDGSKLILFTWNTALNQMRDVMTFNSGTLTIARGTEQPGPSTNATLTYSKAQ